MKLQVYNKSIYKPLKRISKTETSNIILKIPEYWVQLKNEIPYEEYKDVLNKIVEELKK